MAGSVAVWQRHCMPLMDEEATRFDRFDWLQNVLDFMLGPGVAGWLIETGVRATEQDAAFFPLDKVQSNLRAFFVILAYIVALGGGAIWLIQRKDIAGFSPDLLILDDLGLHRMTQQQSIDLYELVIARHRTASFVITSNRAVDEWLGLFDDSILGNSALDRLANASYQIVIEGASYRERLSPHRALLDRKEVVDPQT